MESSDLEIPKLYFNVVSDCKCEIKNNTCGMCRACVCDKHLNDTIYLCNLCVYQISESVKLLKEPSNNIISNNLIYNDEAYDGACLYPCVVCDNFCIDEEIIREYHKISFIESRVGAIISLFICSNCINSKLIINWHTKKEATGIIMNIDNNTIEHILSYPINMANYELIRKAREKLLAKIKKETLKWLISDVADVIVSYCGFIRYIEYEIKNLANAS